MPRALASTSPTSFHEVCTGIARSVLWLCTTNDLRRSTCAQLFFCKRATTCTNTSANDATSARSSLPLKLMRTQLRAATSSSPMASKMRGGSGEPEEHAEPCEMAIPARSSAGSRLRPSTPAMCTSSVLGKLVAGVSTLHNSLELVRMMRTSRVLAPYAARESVARRPPARRLAPPLPPLLDSWFLAAILALDHRRAKAAAVAQQQRAHTRCRSPATHQPCAERSRSKLPAMRVRRGKLGQATAPRRHGGGQQDLCTVWQLPQHLGGFLLRSDRAPDRQGQQVGGLE